METKTLFVSKIDHNRRLDLFLVEYQSEHSRSFWTNHIKRGSVLVNGLQVKAGHTLKENDQITIDLSELAPTTLVSENIPLTIVYEDEDVLVIDKPAGLVVHPGAGHHQGTLANALLHHASQLSRINGDFRPGIVHRIDKDTSGLLLVCKNDDAHRKIAAQLQKHTMQRTYLALVQGEIREEEGKIIAPLARDKESRLKQAVNLDHGKPATTLFTVEERFRGYTLVRCHLLTGRTHQIRVHMAFISHPVEGDPLYQNGPHHLYKKGQLLHATELKFIHPRTGEEVVINSPLPDYFVRVLNNLRMKNKSSL
ncbi:MAG: RluA family pseudouridine synthase [Bacilli bacterium]